MVIKQKTPSDILIIYRIYYYKSDDPMQLLREKESTNVYIHRYISKISLVRPYQK